MWDVKRNAEIDRPGGLSHGCQLALRGEYLFNTPISLAAPAGGCAALFRICLFSQRLPYMCSFSSMSWRRVAPSSDTPAKAPRERDQERISAVIMASVWALAVRPTGPPAIEASAPSVNLLVSSFFMPRSFITSRTRSVEEIPICKPTLPPSMRTAAGAPQPWPEVLRQVTKPRPYFAATTKPPFFKPGTRTIHALLFNKSCGIDLSGEPMISPNNSAASSNRSFVLSFSTAHETEQSPTTEIASAIKRIDLYYLDSIGDSDLDSVQRRTP